MSVTFFDLKRKKTPKPALKRETLVELSRTVIPGYSSYMTYVDTDGIEKKVTEGFSKTSDGSYVLIRTEIDKYDIYEKTAYTYKNVLGHFTYIDGNGETKKFNKLDTLQFDEDRLTYTGMCGTINYINTEVELFEK